MSNPSEQQFTCPNGHEFVANDVTNLDAVACPECLEPVTIEDAAPKQNRGLWAMMQGGLASKDDAPTNNATDDDSVSDDSDTDSGDEWGNDKTALESSVDTSPGSAVNKSDADASTAEEDTDQEDKLAVDRPRGLWALMGGSQEDAADADSDDNNDTALVDRDDSIDDSKADDFSSSDNGDQELDDSSDEFADSSSDSDGSEEDLDDSVDPDPEDGELVDEQEHDGWEVDDPDHIDDLLTPGLPLDRPAPVEREVGKPMGSYVALGVGVSALLFSGLSLLPYNWCRYPATLTGLIGLVMGYQALGECKRSKRPQSVRMLPMIGMSLGLLAMFAGPVYLNQLGAQLREDAEHSQITANILKIESGLNAYHERHGRFPPGSKHEPDEGGVEIPMHSWMTAILPHIGEDRIVNLIDPGKPFDDDVNFEAMRRVVPSFLVPGVEHHSNHLGLATSHFAGVGGQLSSDAGLANVGIFERNSTTSRDDISDGLSQTMLIGEIGTAYPAWGEPDNWRSIGDGLNQQLTGFGNASGTGAHFLMADGSVKFFSNKTSVEVLKALSTRDGGEPPQKIR